MSSRRYRLVCPIARALDRIGDRWTLLLLRDLHAGPARFGELQAGLPGLAPNLLASRLTQLQEDGLVDRVEDDGVPRYSLTETGEGTAPILAELAWFGSTFEPDHAPSRPGNMRLIAVPLQEALRGVISDRTALHAELQVDDEPLTIRVANGDVTVRLGPDESAPLALATDYESLLASGEGRLDQEMFFATRVQVLRGSQRAVQSFTDLMTKAFGGV